MAYSHGESEWNRKGATLSDKHAREEFGLTQEEIYDAFRAGRLQYREGSTHGNPWFRLLRREVEALAKENRGAQSVAHRKKQMELADINRGLRSLKIQMGKLEKRKAELGASLK